MASCAPWFLTSPLSVPYNPPAHVNTGKKQMPHRYKLLFLLVPAASFSFGCTGSTTPFTSSVPVPAAGAPFDAVWAYAASLEPQVQPFAARRFRDYPEGLRRAVRQHRVTFLANGAVPGSLPELQSYLFFEYRRQLGLAGNDRPGAPDATTARYVQALLQAIRERLGQPAP